MSFYGHKYHTKVVKTAIQLLVMQNTAKLCTTNTMVTSKQGRIKTKSGLMLLPIKEPIFFFALKTDLDV